ncbi:hypothetical protein LUX39_38600 [Actinomadura madurae]|nr:hypothetical protein [Actinomadura madurae]MCP9953503.1 hypothetical protein [Actinomadura madurae]MCQ0018968.1 hypothetical protein [Actinomadura madurae]
MSPSRPSTPRQLVLDAVHRDHEQGRGVEPGVVDPRAERLGGGEPVPDHAQQPPGLLPLVPLVGGGRGLLGEPLGEAEERHLGRHLQQRQAGAVAGPAQRLGDGVGHVADAVADRAAAAGLHRVGERRARARVPQRRAGRQDELVAAQVGARVEQLGGVRPADRAVEPGLPGDQAQPEARHRQELPDGDARHHGIAGHSLTFSPRPGDGPRP